MKHLLKTHLTTAQSMQYWLKKTGLKQDELAEKVGLSQGAISNMARGARDIKAEYLERMCGVFGISLAEFFLCDKGDLPEVAFVPLVKAVPRAGSGGLEVDATQKRLYSFHTDFLERKGGSAGSMRLFIVDGDSMEPTIKGGDMIMVNLLDSAVRSGHIYLVRLEGELMVKRLERLPGGGILVKSDNRQHSEHTIDPAAEHIDFAVLGRMCWLCREF
ncbi:MAG: helix-turn-helix domain-containing protein [Deltaproteobacteria bacterium]|nr:helix-turn-helix domain-containing protein [Deltaproteobacteria bacterium]